MTCFFHRSLIAALAITIATPVFSQQTSVQTPPQQANAVKISPKAFALQRAPIKSLADLQVFRNKTSALDSPLARLSAAAQKRFIQSLTFNEKGVTSFSYADLQLLSPTDVHRVLALLGYQHLARSVALGPAVTDSDRAIMAGSFFVGSKKFDTVNRSVTNSVTNLDDPDLDPDGNPYFDPDDYSWGGWEWGDFGGGGGGGNPDFGTGRDYIEYWCVGRGTCAVKTGYICTSNC